MQNKVYTRKNTESTVNESKTLNIGKIILDNIIAKIILSISLNRLHHHMVRLQQEISSTTFNILNNLKQG